MYAFIYVLAYVVIIFVVCFNFEMKRHILKFIVDFYM